MLDLLIRGGTVVDGTGASGFRGDVGIRDGSIVAVGDIDEPARQRLDANGLVVAPGFVDIHTHYDAQLFWDPFASPSPLHGVTTVIGGNCGFSLAPAGREHAAYLMRMLARVEGMPLEALQTGLDWDWTSFGGWLDRLQGRIAVNAGFLAGHSAVRRVVMGDAATAERASERQIEEMARLLHRAISDGALGFSTSQSPTHSDWDSNPVPSRLAAAEEMLALAAVVGDHPGTTLELILPGCLSGFTPEEVELMASISLAGNRPVNWNVLGVSAANPDAHVHQLDASTRAAERGARVIALTLPHSMRVRLSFLSGFILDALPGWRQVMSRPVAERMQALSDPAVRRRLAEGAASPEAGILRGLSNWGRLELVETFAEKNQALAGRSVGSVAGELGKEPFDALLDIVVADELRTGISPPDTTGSDEDWRLRAEVWRDPRTIVGGSDSGAHLDMMCGAIYSTSLLGNAVRDRGLLSLEEAVHQLTDVPARLYGLRGRGRLSEGWRADIVVFDPGEVGHGPERTRHDLPAGAPRLYADAVGIRHVLVNGGEIVRDGAFTGAMPGRLLRSDVDTETVAVPGGAQAAGSGSGVEAGQDGGAA
ncbi:MAG: D-aminoacylase [Chloroflexi bacterium]|nr:MAG: D-aminoacylase [Chloroflexota bacterium]